MKIPIPEEYQGLPVVTAAEMQSIDRRAIEGFGISALDLMENAGRGVARETAAYVEGRLSKKVAETLITVCCGRGNNGGDGLVAARFLKEMGGEVMVFIAPPKREGSYSQEVQTNLTAAASAGVSVHQASEELVELDVRLRSSALLIDALLGTGASGKPAGLARKIIQRMMKAAKPIVAIDIPSGLNPDTGYHSGVVVPAVLTCTLGLPKRGLLAQAAQRYVGELKVIDIGFPPEAFESFRKRERK
ncbi:MAG: NAD(P)H-hydrate epimerase [Elusimicrobia bacterium]|nr:NAD(P)H-hydrate epimerase [Elusimicrobiota bacterium]